MQCPLTTPETVSLDILAAAGAATSVAVVAEVHRVVEEEEEEVKVISKGNTPVLFSFLSVTKQYMCGCSLCHFLSFSWSSHSQSLCSLVGCQLLHWNKTSDMKSNCRWSMCWRSSTATCHPFWSQLGWRGGGTRYVHGPVETCIPS